MDYPITLNLRPVIATDKGGKGNWPKPETHLPKRYDSMPVKMPAEHFAALKVVAARRGSILSGRLREIVEDWLSRQE
jgi:hypothetical protein